jgi:crotonobetainyl-CoA:carnitine CoA-transferase CaiB-like acyl-CoA transferase
MQGVMVVDMTTVGMGPYATQILGDMGAEIVKIETAEGDPFRDVDPSRNPKMGAPFLNLNRNKRSIVLDMRQEADRAHMFRLLDRADVFVSNTRPAGLQRLGLDAETLLADRPRLIHCSLVGFSERGPYAGRPAFDDIIQAMSGLAALQGHNGAEPAYVNTIIADKVTGLAASGAIAMALFERERSGRGQAVEVPMFEFMSAFTLVEHLSGATFSPETEGTGYDRVLSPDRRPYRTLDGHVSVLPYTTAHWQRFFEAAGRPELMNDPDLVDPNARSRTIGRWYQLLAAVVAERTTAEWLDIAKATDVPMAPINSPKDLLDDPHLNAIGFFGADEHPTEGAVRTLGIPIQFSRTPGSIRNLAPELDGDRAELLAEIYGQEEIR